MIKFDSVSKVYKNESHENLILSDVSIEFDSNAIHCITGSSGSGKTTLLNLIGCLDTDFSGEISINNNQVSAIKNLELFRNIHIGFMFQSHNLLSQLTVRDNILLPAHIYAQDSDEVLGFMNNLLDYVGLIERKNFFPSCLSGGERQRVAFVRSLINKPHIVVADEPTGNVDDKNSKIIVDLISKYNADYGQTFIVATHDKLVSESADFLYEINNMNCIKL